MENTYFFSEDIATWKYVVKKVVQKLDIFMNQTFKQKQ